MRTHVLDVPWEERDLARRNGGRYDPKLKKQIFTGDVLPPALQDYETQDYSWERWLEDDINKSYRQPAKTPHIFKPRDYQLLAAKRITQAAKDGSPGFLLADDVGLGKTLSSILGAYGVARLMKKTPKRPAKLLIVCPNHAIPAWRNTLRASGVDEHFRVAIINYEKLKKMLKEPPSAKTAKRTATKNKRIASQGTPLINWDIVIADESQKLKNIYTAQQSKAFERVAANSFKIWLSATAGQNPVEVGYLAPIFAHLQPGAPKVIKDWGEYLIKQGYGVTMGKVGATWVNPALKKTPEEQAKAMEQRKKDLTRIRHILFKEGAPTLRRLPQDLAGWHTLQRIPLPHQLSVAERIAYRKAWTEFSAEYRKIMASKDPKGVLAVQTRLRQKISLIKVNTTIDEIIDLVENGKQVAVSVVFVESADALKEKLDSAGIRNVEFIGRTRQAGQAENNRLQFQRGQAEVIIFSPVDAVSFHAGETLPDGTQGSLKDRAMIIHDLRYSGIENIQVSGRTHRDGKNSITYFPYFEDTIEDKILNVILQRIQAVHTISGDSDELVGEIDNLLQQMVLHA